MASWEEDLQKYVLEKSNLPPAFFDKNLAISSSSDINNESVAFAVPKSHHRLNTKSLPILNKTSSPASSEPEKSKSFLKSFDSADGAYSPYPSRFTRNLGRNFLPSHGYNILSNKASDKEGFDPRELVHKDESQKEINNILQRRNEQEEHEGIVTASSRRKVFEKKIVGFDIINGAPICVTYEKELAESAAEGDSDGIGGKFYDHSSQPLITSYSPLLPNINFDLLTTEQRLELIKQREDEKRTAHSRKDFDIISNLDYFNRKEYKKVIQSLTSASSNDFLNDGLDLNKATKEGVDKDQDTLKATNFTEVNAEGRVSVYGEKNAGLLSTSGITSFDNAPLSYPPDLSLCDRIERIQHQRQMEQLWHNAMKKAAEKALVSTNNYNPLTAKFRNIDDEERDALLRAKRELEIREKVTNHTFPVAEIVDKSEGEAFDIINPETVYNVKKTLRIENGRRENKGLVRRAMARMRQEQRADFSAAVTEREEQRRLRTAYNVVARAREVFTRGHDIINNRPYVDFSPHLTDSAAVEEGYGPNLSNDIPHTKFVEAAGFTGGDVIKEDRNTLPLSCSYLSTNTTSNALFPPSSLSLSYAPLCNTLAATKDGPLLKPYMPLSELKPKSCLELLEENAKRNSVVNKVLKDIDLTFSQNPTLVSETDSKIITPTLLARIDAPLTTKERIFHEEQFLSSLKRRQDQKLSPKTPPNSLASTAHQLKVEEKYENKDNNIVNNNNSFDNSKSVNRGNNGITNNYTFEKQKRHLLPVVRKNGQEYNSCSLR